MKKLFLITFLILPYFLHAQAVKSPVDTANSWYPGENEDIQKVLPPRSTTLVTDYTNTLSTKDKQRLEDKLVAVDQASTAQIAVVIVETVGKFNIMHYGRRLAKSWGIGQKDKNNGVLVLLALNDRKVAIITGIGLQNVVTDSFCTNVIQYNFLPHFKTGDFFGGLDEGTDRIIKLIKGG
jgi:uncharacterized protein